MMNELVSRNIDLNTTSVYERLFDLYQAIRVTQPINYYLESSQDPDKVLDIFVRVNSGGTTLSYSDLLLSMATNQWTSLDAREEVRSHPRAPPTRTHQCHCGCSFAKQPFPS